MSLSQTWLEEEDECSKPKQHVSCTRDGWLIHQKHKRDVSGQLCWREQLRLEFKHYYVKNCQPRLETFRNELFQLSTILQYLEKPESTNEMIMKLFLLRIRTTNTEMLGREKLIFETSLTAGC